LAVLDVVVRVVRCRDGQAGIHVPEDGEQDVDEEVGAAAGD
jgi:hypothetical protein